MGDIHKICKPYLDKLESQYKYPKKAAISQGERVERAIAREKPDRTPFDYWAVEEMTSELKPTFSSEGEDFLLRMLGID